MKKKTILDRFVGLFEETKFLKALARAFSLAGATAAFFGLIYKLRSYVTNLGIHISISFISLIFSMILISRIFDKIYGKIRIENRIVRHPFLSYRQALVRAIRLSAVDHSYFLSLILIKFSRIMFSSFSIAFLMIYMRNDRHKELFHIYFSNYIISIHEVLDFLIKFSVITLSIWIFWQIYEISIISQNTASFVNKRRNAMVRKRNAAIRVIAID